MKKIILYINKLFKKVEEVEVKEKVDNRCICEINGDGGKLMGWCYKHKTDWM